MSIIESNQDRVRARAHAKVNLTLAVGPPRPDGVEFAGYHPIASWMHAIALYDDIEIRRAETSSYDLAWVDGTPVDWDAESDLCVKAHRAVEAIAGRSLPIRMMVRKRIPAGGGLGGGSGDAGTVMLALRDLFTLPISDDELVSCAHGIGTDIPFFVDPVAWRSGQSPRPAVVSGLGDRIDRVGRLSDPITLILPEFGCPTGDVYRAFDAEPTASCDTARVMRIVADGVVRGSVDSGVLFNDLAAPAERIEPRLEALRALLSMALSVPVHVSGSGSTLFCVGRVTAPIPRDSAVRVVASQLK